MKPTISMINTGTGSVNLNEAIRITEASRFRMGVTEFVKLTIESWAHAQTGLYPPTKTFPDDLEVEAKKLVHCLSVLMRQHPGDDVIGKFLSECNFHLRGTNFYPTPPEIANLMAALLGDKTSKNELSFYEACSGTGSLAMQWVINLVNTKGVDALTQAKLTLEDIDPLMVQASMLQLLFLFEHIGASPKSLSIEAIDVLSRKSSKVAYYASSKTEVDDRIYNHKSQSTLEPMTA